MCFEFLDLTLLLVPDMTTSYNIFSTTAARPDGFLVRVGWAGRFLGVLEVVGRF